MGVANILLAIMETIYVKTAIVNMLINIYSIEYHHDYIILFDNVLYLPAKIRANYIAYCFIRHTLIFYLQKYVRYISLFYKCEISVAAPIIPIIACSKVKDP